MVFAIEAGLARAWQGLGEGLARVWQELGKGLVRTWQGLGNGLHFLGSDLAMF